MAENSKIQWTDHTFNPWRGCTKIAPGCANCYADAQSKRNPGTLGVWGPSGTRVLASEAMWREPVKWDRDVETTAEVWPDHRPRVFCASLADVFEDWPGIMRGPKGGYLHHADKWNVRDGRPYIEIADIAIGKSRVTMADARARLFRLIDATTNLDLLLLTKRPENVRRMWMPVSRETWSRRMSGVDMIDPEWKPTPEQASGLYRQNVWLGTSIACQEDADRNIPELLKCRDLCSKLFVSVEPLVGHVDLSKYVGGSLYRCECGYHATENELIFTGGDNYSCTKCGGRCKIEKSIDWVIVGGESGPHARPCNVEWIRSIVRQCQAAGVPVFVKQLGAHVIGSENERHEMCGICIDKRPGTDAIVKWKIRDKKGGDPSEWPEDLRVREFPTANERS